MKKTQIKEINSGSIVSGCFYSFAVRDRQELSRQKVPETDTNFLFNGNFRFFPTPAKQYLKVYVSDI